MSDKTSKKRKRDDSEEEVQLEHKKKKKKTNNKNNNNSDKEDEVMEVDVATTKEKKKSKKSKKDDKEDKDNSGSEKEASKKQTKEKTKKAATDPDQETAASEDIDTTKPKKKSKTTKKKNTKAAEPVEPAKADESESEDNDQTDKDKKKKKKKKSKKNNTNAQTDSAEEMSETNVTSKRGRFSKTENELLETKIFEYIAAQGWTRDEGLDNICNGKIRERQGAWKEIASVVPERAWRAVASHCRRKFNPDNYKGSWTTEEEDELRQLYGQHGAAWRLIGTELGRLMGSCRDKWRQIEEDVLKGPWTAEEDAKLLAAVKEVNGGSLPNADSPAILWSVVAKRVNTRHVNQCQARWRKINPSQNSLSSHEWMEDDYKKLLVKVHSLKPQDSSEITLSQLSKAWSYKTISVRWPMLLKHVPDHKNLKLPQVLKQLIAQYGLSKKDIAKIKQEIIDEGW